ncbi:GAF domain-containing protein [Bradyrhizobium vignae]|uniref:histidine kinase n=1 Tax=Bradyrhizobium vignae TaxID=1549949 RepID=A0A2U3Q762_9BRAD|nr:GAF domain-containing protein [Bradyrhizobium vignae]SPP97188.1 His Kinase A (Phosphoacceptor) domain/Histidine kinase-, DNA gyrase B-, and HSP90-like ATPase/GAF domain protein [Bradyrhizobium vignae]
MRARDARSRAKSGAKSARAKSGKKQTSDAGTRKKAGKPLTKTDARKAKPSLHPETALLKRQLKAARMREEAGAEILRAIANASGDAAGPLQLITETTARLFKASSVSLQLAEGREFTQEYRVGTIAKRVGSAYPRSNIKVGGRKLPGTVVAESRQIHIPDLDHLDPSMSDFPGLPHARAGGARTVCGTPLRRNDKAVGALIVFRDRLLPFTVDELALLQSFADQAMIAIQNAQLFNDTQQALERQTATSEILRVISQSPTDAQPVFDSIVQTAVRLTRCDLGFFLRCDGASYVQVARATPEGLTTVTRPPEQIDPDGNFPSRAIIGKKTLHLPDWSLIDLPKFELWIHETFGIVSSLYVPLLRAGECIGLLVLAGKRSNFLGEREVALAESFCDQALIAIENVRLFDEVQARTRELTEALTYQTGSSNILRVIASSPTDVAPVLQAIVESACELCEAKDAIVYLRDGNDLRFNAQHGPLEFTVEKWPIDRATVAGRTFLDRAPVHIHDMLSEEGNQFPEGQRAARRIGVRTMLGVPLLREGESIGTILLRRTEVNPFSDKQVTLLQTFADQAVIAISNVNLFKQVQERTRDLEESLQQQTATSEVLQVISRSVFDLKTVLRTLLESAAGLCDASICILFQSQGDLLHVGASYGGTPEFVEYLSTHPHRLDRTTVAGRTAVERRTVHIPDIGADTEYGLPQSIKLGGWRSIIGVPLLRDGEVLGVLDLARPVAGPFTPRQIKLIETFADQAVIAIENARLFDEVQQRTKELAASLDELRTAQDRLVQTEKLASLGQLTAGIAHEIKNPLNFINNFSALSAELIEEMNDVFENPTLDEAGRWKELDEIRELLKSNLEKVVQHGKRADSILKNMLQHSREGSGEQRMVDINALLDESLNLAYHGARAEKPDFNITLQRDLDPDAGVIELFPQEITRALLNLISNGFYAASKRRADIGDANFEPVLSAGTRNLGNHIEIRIRDNGTGIPPEVKEKMFNPFFTTKPAGEGTGLGLSMSHDIIVKQHGGRIEVDTQPGQFTEFTIVLPRAGNLTSARKN